MILHFSTLLEFPHQNILSPFAESQQKFVSQTKVEMQRMRGTSQELS